MKSSAWIALSCLALMLTGCVSGQVNAPAVPPRGLLLTIYRAPLTVNFERTPVQERSAEGSTFYFVDPIFTNLDFAWGRAHIEEVVNEGKLRTVQYADYRLLEVLQLFKWFTIIAYGE